MAASRLKKPEVIDRLFEQKQLMARLSVSPKTYPLIWEANNLTWKSVNNILSGNLDDSCWQIMDKQDITELVNEIGPSQADQIRQRISRYVQKIMATQSYQNGLEAYQNQDDHIASDLFRRSLDQFLSTYMYQDLTNLVPNKRLYHGVQVAPELEFSKPKAGQQVKLIPAAEYADTLASITKNGLRATAKMENLPGMESVFAVTKPEHTYGLAGVHFDLAPTDKAWGITRGEAEGFQLVKPVVKNPATIYLKSLEFLDPDLLDMSPCRDVLGELDIDRFMDYQQKLEAELQKRGLPYQIIFPSTGEVMAAQ